MLSNYIINTHRRLILRKGWAGRKVVLSGEMVNHIFFLTLDKPSVSNGLTTHVKVIHKKTGENILNEASTKPKADRVSNTIQIFFLDVIVIAKDDRHYFFLKHLSGPDS